VHCHAPVVVPETLTVIKPIHAEEDNPMVNVILRHRGVECVPPEHGHGLAWIHAHMRQRINLKVMPWPAGQAGR